jgi:hypothetical protein
MILENKFELGQQVVVSKRTENFYPFKPWREGEITAVSEIAVRIRFPKGWKRQRWIPIYDINHFHVGIVTQ